MTPPPATARKSVSSAGNVVRRRSAVRHHRRVSGPATSRNGAIAAPRPVPQLPFGTLAGKAADAICTVRDSQLVDRLVRGQGWIALLGILLIGLVGLNVALLKLNAQNGRAAETARDLRIENAKLRGAVSRLGSSDRLQQAARDMGLVMPTPQMVNYLQTRPNRDGRLAAKNVRLDLPPPADELLVSASPEAERELAAPTPSQPIAEAMADAQAENAAAATGATGATGVVAPQQAVPAGTTGATGATGVAGTPGG